jgi:hypothetical protein
MHRSVVAASRRVFQASSLEQSAQIVESNPSLELQEGSLDDVLQLEPVDRARAVEREQMTPRFGSKAPPFMWAHYAECGLCRNSFVHWRSLLFHGRGKLDDFCYKLLPCKPFRIENRIGCLVQGLPFLVQLP